MNKNIITPSSSKPRFAWFPYLVVIILLLAVLLLWSELSSTRQNLAELVQKQTALAGELKTAKAELDQLNSGDSSQETKDRLVANRQKRTDQPEQEKAETLALQPPTASQIDGGILVHLSFESKTSEAPTSVALIMRIPVDANSRIIALTPADPSLYSDIETHIDEHGKFAVIKGELLDHKALQFNLTVTAPTKVVIQGTSGIKGFELQISEEQAVALQL